MSLTEAQRHREKKEENCGDGFSVLEGRKNLRFFPYIQARITVSHNQFNGSCIKQAIHHEEREEHEEFWPAAKRGGGQIKVNLEMKE